MFRALVRATSIARPSFTCLASQAQIRPQICISGAAPSISPSAIMSQIGGVRHKGTHGREYQPSTIKRKRKFGFLARMTDRHGRKVIARRKAKGRWYLTH